MRLRRAARDRGQVTPVLLLFVVVTAGVGMALFQVGRASVAQTGTQSGADAAALAAAASLRDQMLGILQRTAFNEPAELNLGLATRAARDYAARNGARLVDVDYEGLRATATVETAQPLGDTGPLDRAQDARGRADATAEVDILYTFPAVQAGVGGTVSGGSCTIPDAEIRLAAQEAGVNPDQAVVGSVLARYDGCGNAPGVSVAGLQFQMRVALLQVEEALGGPLILASGFRTPAYQAQLCMVVDGPCAPPGRSMHGIGLAVDVVDYPQVAAVIAANPEIALCQPLPADDAVHFSHSTGRECGGGQGTLGPGGLFGGNLASFATFDVRLVE